MTAITANGFSRSTPTRLRLTTRGRRALATIAALPAVVALAIAVVSGGAALASREASAASDQFTSIVVGAGDSLWSIAEEVAPTADPRDVVDEIVRLNALEGAGISAGQRLAVPSQYVGAP